VHQYTADKGVIEKTSGPWHLISTPTKGSQVFHDKELTKVPRSVHNVEMVARLSTVVDDAITRFAAQQLRDTAEPVKYSHQAKAQARQNREYNNDMLLNRYIVGNRLVDVVHSLAKSNPAAFAQALKANQIFHREEARRSSEDSFRHTDNVKVMGEQLKGLQLLREALTTVQHTSLKSDADIAVYHMEGFPAFHPPSLKNPQHIPADQPGETDDRFLDVTKRKSRENALFNDQLTRNQGQPTTVRTTLVEPGTYVPFDKL
jgi:hypothetical protein